MSEFSMTTPSAKSGGGFFQKNNLNRNGVLLGIFLLQIVVTYAILSFYGLTEHFEIGLYAMILYVSLGLVVFVKGLTYALLWLGLEKSERNLKKLLSDFRTGWVNADYMLAFILPMMFLPVFLSVFSSLKSVIFMIQPFYLDEFLMEADRLLHFGVDPWKITHVLFGSSFATSTINYFYNLWFFLMYSYVLWQVVNVKFGARRMQFLYSFILVWLVIGGLFALLFSSAGPCYYADVVGTDVYGALMAKLNVINDGLLASESSVNIWALDTQISLWDAQQSGTTAVGGGISAMPSMHVSVATLLYLSSREVSRIMGRAFLAFLVIIQVGSVHLAWHYALDGYVSILLTWAIWHFAGWLVRKVDNQDQYPLLTQTG